MSSEVQKPQLAPGESYPAEFRIKALQCLERHNGVIKPAAHEMGCSEERLRKWAKDSGQIAPTRLVLVNQAVGPVKQELESAVKQILAGLPLKIKNASLKDSVDALSRLVPLLSSLQETPPPGETSPEAVLLNKLRAQIKKKVDTEGVEG